MPYRSAVIDRIHIVRWREPTLADVVPVVEEVKRAATKAGTPFFGIAIVPEDASVPDDRTREAMSKRLPELFEVVESMHFVVEGTGFRLAIVRSVIAAFVFLSSKSRGRLFVHSTVDSALIQIRLRLTVPTADIAEKAGRLGLLSRGV